MNYAAWKFWTDIILIVINALIGFYVWWSNREKVTTTRFTGLEERMTKVETKVERMPVCGNHANMEANDKEISKRLDEMHGDLRELAGGVKGINRAVDLINQFLIEQGGKK